MNGQLISVIALSMTMTAGGYAQNLASPESAETAVLIPQDDDFTPMTASERLGEYVTGTFGPKSIIETATHAGLDEIRRKPQEWPGTVSGFGVRVGKGFAQHAVRGTLQRGVAFLLHEDNRYRRSTQKGFWRRTKSALPSTFLTRHDNGRRGFAFSRIGSAGGASFIARAWLPRSIATVGAGFSSFGLTIAADVGSNLLREFWPDLKHRLRRQ